MSESHIDDMTGKQPFVVPAMRERYPAGCPDPDYCCGNGRCFWACVYGEEDEKYWREIFEEDRQREEAEKRHGR